MVKCRVGDTVQLTVPVGGTKFKWGTHKIPEVSVPDDTYIVLKKTRSKIRLAVQLDPGVPSSKHIYEISKRNFWVLQCKR